MNMWAGIRMSQPHARDRARSTQPADARQPSPPTPTQVRNITAIGQRSQRGQRKEGETGTRVGATVGIRCRGALHAVARTDELMAMPRRDGLESKSRRTVKLGAAPHPDGR